MDRLKNKIAIVTGGGAGIGKAIVKSFVREGARVIALDIDEKALKSLSEELDEKLCIPLKCDVTKSIQINEVINGAWDKFGNVDILVNCAGGSMGHSIHLLDITEEMWDKVVEFNLKSVFLFSQAFIRKHRERDTKGVIVNISSQGGIQPNESQRPHYGAAKAGIIGLSKHMSKEFGPYGFRINVVAPGYCMNERTKKLWEERDTDAILRNVALRRISNTDEQAAAVLFLCSDEASYIAGETLNVCGGGF